MKKKLLTTAMAATMVVGGVMSASAEDLSCKGWWTAHSQGYEIDENGIEVTFSSVSGADAAGNWCTPTYVVYTGSEAKVGCKGYNELMVMRSDNYGWAPKFEGADANTGVALENFNKAGYYVNSTFAEGFDWAKWLEANKAGVDCKLLAKKTDGYVWVTLENAGVTSTVAVPVDSKETVYVSITGENCEIKGITCNPSPTAEDVEVEFELPEKEEETTVDNSSVNTSVTTGGVIDCEGLKDGQTLEMKDVEETSAVYKKVAELLSKVEAFAKSKFVVKELDVMADGKVVKVEEGKYEVTLALDEELKDAKSVIVYRLEGETLVFIAHVDVEGKAFTFTTDHFSTYVFVGSDKTVKDTPAGSIPKEIKSETTTEETTTVAEDKKSDEAPALGDSNTAAIVVVAVVAAGAALAVAATKKKEA